MPLYQKPSVYYIQTYFLPPYLPLAIMIIFNIVSNVSMSLLLFLLFLKSSNPSCKYPSNSVTSLPITLIIALVVVMAIGLYFTLSVPKIEEPAPEVVPPPREITLTLLGNDCDDCTDLSRAVDALKQQEGMNVTEVTELSIEESKELAEKYEITRLPALLILGNTSGLTLPNFNTKEDALVFDQVPPPYYDVAEEKLKGDVTVVLLMDQTCTDCFNLSQVIQQLSDAGLKIVNQSVVDSNDVEGKGMIEQLEAAYYEKVKDADGNPLTVPAGGGETHYAMCIEEKYHDEDIAKQQQRNIDSTQKQAQKLGEEEYVPRGQTSVVEREII